MRLLLLIAGADLFVSVIFSRPEDKTLSARSDGDGWAVVSSAVVAGGRSAGLRAVACSSPAG